MDRIKEVYDSDYENLTQLKMDETKHYRVDVKPNPSVNTTTIYIMKLHSNHSTNIQRFSYIYHYYLYIKQMKEGNIRDNDVLIFQTIKNHHFEKYTTEQDRYTSLSAVPSLLILSTTSSLYDLR